MPSHSRTPKGRIEALPSAEVRRHVVALLRAGHAHVAFQDAVAGLRPALRGKRPRQAEHSAWQLVEHIRIAQRDILDFSRNGNGKYRPLKWPEDYWPEGPTPPSARAWTVSVKAVNTDRLAMERLVLDPTSDLLTAFPWGDGQTLLHEAMMVADHTAYHVGQLIVLRRLLGAWKQ